VITVAGKFCSECGYENSSKRGACRLCYAPLDQPGEAAECPQCGAGNPASANFCQQCGAALVEGAQPATSTAAAAALVVAAAGESLAPAAEPDMVEVGGLDVVGGEAETLVAEPAGPGIEAEVGELIEPAEVEEEYVPPAPGTVGPEELIETEEELEEEFAPPPPPAAMEVEEEEFAPPPPPGALELEEETAAPEAVVPEEPEIAQEEFAPPPSPPGAVSLEEEEAKEPEESEGWDMSPEEQ